MSTDLWEKAEALANRPYTTKIIEDETTKGNNILLAFTPELEGCMAQGKNIDEALANLKEARIDYIYSLLENNLPVPEPQLTITRSTSYTVLRIEDFNFELSDPLSDKMVKEDGFSYQYQDSDELISNVAST